MTAPAFVGPLDDLTQRAPRFVWHVDDGRGRLGQVVIDEIVAARACGGLRIAAVVTEEELGELAAVMTLKFAFFGIACGGAKAGLVVPDDTSPDERRRRTRAFGAALAPLVRFGTYIPGTDLGCRARDLWDVLSAAGVPAGAPPGPLADAIGTAAFSGRSAALAALAALGGIERPSLAVLGYGRVGGAMAARFARSGGRLLAVSTARGAFVHPNGFDVARLERLRAIRGDDAPLEYPGARRVDPDAILALDADVLAPCATVGMIDADAARTVRCRVVAPGANAAVTAGAESILGAAGVTVLPDFVTNAGGVLVSHFWPIPLDDATIEALLEVHFRGVVTDLLRRAAAMRATPADLARQLARRSLTRLSRHHREAMRHERLLARLGRSRLRRALPRAAIMRLVLHVARDLAPPGD
jgi:glutamate dehydrogenase/leucine dehydrogenase